MKYLIKIISLLTVLSTVCITFSSCGKKSGFSEESLAVRENTLTHSYTFDSDNSSRELSFDTDMLNNFVSAVKALNIDYGYDEMFNYQKAMEGMNADFTVERHKNSALDENGILTKEHLLEIVNKNTADYLNSVATGIIHKIDDRDFLLRICEIIVQATNDILNQYPEIDKARVYCNLGNLKIVEKKSALDFAAVEPGMILHLNGNTAQIADIMEGKSMYSVIVHETMHIIQYGCSCEPDKSCIRRCGFARAHSEWEQDYSDWMWLEEASAERMACLYSDVQPMTYENMVKYLTTLDFVTMLQNDVPADYLEVLSFFGDSNKLFELFGCENERDRKEIYRLIYALEMMQMKPDDVKDAYKKNYGVELSDSVADDFNLKIKRPILQTATKLFYINLAHTVLSGALSENDLFFLINLYESTLNYHLCFDMEKYDSYNAEFLKWYKQIKESFWPCFSNADENEYATYNIIKAGSILNAGMNRLDSGKKIFLADKYQAVEKAYKIS